MCIRDASGPGRVSPVPGGAASGRVWQPGDQTSRPQHPTGAPPGVAQQAAAGMRGTEKLILIQEKKQIHQLDLLFAALTIKS
ncbi:hypothetical protein E2562_004754 [Oryza meyeriana var. granulata]|uniref:Uncharacterized protein n=1 Tax=Oryza meyeriana var. granulata TaxID=110450 RepID=A0A6G1DEB0_9ORYZ|nr:hypothetical protein E2562_004754 [Oryza meyeriana var. granulata]